MKTKFAITMIFSLLFGVMFPVAAQPKPTKTETKKEAKSETKTQLTGGRFALLIGINKYKDPDINQLGGCENDVRMMKQLLMEQYGFRDDAAGKNVKTLLSAEATRKGILDNFNTQLLTKAESYYKTNNLNANKKDQGATVVFYYSGHGATLPDLDKTGTKLAGEEADGFDETIVPHDSKSDGTNAIIDDEFDDLFNKLSQWTTNIVFIFDSCHSGTVTRAGSLTRRTEFKYKLPAKVEEEIALMRSKGRDVGNNSNLTDGINDNAEEEKIGYVTISGCLPNQLSQEDSLTDPITKKTQQNGLLTFYLIQELRRNPAASYNEVMRTVQKAVRLENPEQIPQFEGDVDRPVFNIVSDSGTKPRPKSIRFEKLENMKIKLESGKIVGAFEGGIVALYSKDAMKLTGENERIGSGTIETADDFTSTVKVSLKDVNLKEVPANAQIALVTPYFGSGKRTIVLDNSPVKTGNSAAVMQRVSELAREDKFVTTKEINNPRSFARPARDWDAAVLRMTYKDFKFGNEQAKTKALTAPKDEDEVYILADKNDMPLYNFYVSVTDANAAQKIAEALEKHVRVENIRTFGNGTAEGINDKLKLEIVPVVAGKINPGTGTCPVAEVAADKRVKSGKVEIFKPGQQFYFKITNNTGQDLFLYLYDIAPDGSISWLFPDKRRNIDESLTNENTISTFGKNQCYIFGVTLPEKTDAPFGIETFKLIATTQKINGRMLESAAIAKGQRDGSSPLGQLLAQASTNETRSGVDTSLEFSGWATVNLDIEVREK